MFYKLVIDFPNAIYTSKDAAKIDADLLAKMLGAQVEIEECDEEGNSIQKKGYAITLTNREQVVVMKKHCIYCDHFDEGIDGEHCKKCIEIFSKSGVLRSLWENKKEKGDNNNDF